jgi:hypothetical protein
MIGLQIVGVLCTIAGVFITWIGLGSIHEVFSRRTPEVVGVGWRAFALAFTAFGVAAIVSGVALAIGALR